MLKTVFFRRFLTLSGLWLLAGCAFAQPLTGTVHDGQGEPMVGATVRWLDGTGTVTEADGSFTLERPDTATVLLTSFIGFGQTRTTVAPGQTTVAITLREGETLAAVEVSYRRQGSFTSTLETRNVESITSKELRKAPCCSLAESFETNPTVDLSYGDPLTGTREIQVLGLRGNYTLLTLEKRPALNGLATPYAMDFIPGTWLQGLQVGKGAGSVESSAAGLNGQLNAELMKPQLDKPLFVNLFGSTLGRLEANVHLNKRLNDHWSTGLLLHGSGTEGDHDRDFDGFQDNPNRRTAAGLYRLFYQGGYRPWEGQFNVLAIRDRRLAGQIDVHDHGQPSLNPYLLEQANDRVEVFGKTGYFGFEKTHQSVGFIWSGAYHRLDNSYGGTRHLGTQRSAYANLLYATRIANDQHQITLGTSWQYDDFVETYADRDLSRTERTGGAYAEYTYQISNGERPATLILAGRLDHHSVGDWQASPRANFKINLTPDNALRLSAGRGWRSPNVLADNLRWLPTSRRLELDGPPALETAWNYGLNWTQNFRVGDREGSFVLDLYRTDFQNQLVIDVEQDATRLLLYNVDGPSYANAILLTGSYEVLPGLDLKLAYKYNRVQTTYATNGLRDLPLTPRRRALATLDYEGRRWRVNLTYQWVGEQRLPDHGVIPESVRVFQPQVADPFGLVNAQITWVANDRLEFYAGGENLTGQRQANAIIGAYDPFYGDYFDATQVYQPLMGAQAFVGLRYSVE